MKPESFRQSGNRGFSDTVPDRADFISNLAFFPDESFIALQNKEVAETEGLPVSAVIDRLDYWQTIGVQAIGQGDWAGPALKRAQVIMESIVAVRPEPLLHIIADRLVQRFTAEQQHPTMGIVRYEHDPHVAQRAPARFLANDQELLNRLTPNPPLEATEVGQRVASDVLGVFDRSGVLRSVARLPRGEHNPLPDPFPVSQRQITQGKAWLESSVPLSTGLFGSALLVVEACSSELQGQLENAVPAASVGVIPGWAEFLQDCRGYSRMQLEIRRYQGEHSGQWDDIAKFSQQLRAKNPALQERYFANIEAISQHRDEIVAVLQAILNNVQAARDTATLHIERIDVHTAVDDPLWSPFTGSDTADSENRSLLLRYVYRHDMRQAIEERFAIRFSDISFQAQLQLVQFLVQAGPPTVRKFEAAMKTAGLETGAFLESFFALAENQAIGNDIIHLVESVPDVQELNQLLTIYRDITQVVGSIEDVMMTTLGERASVVDIRAVTKNVLRRANHLLLSPLQSGGTMDVTRCRISLAAVQSDLVAFAAIVQTALKSHDGERSIELADIVGVEMITLNGQDIDIETRRQMIEIATHNYRDEPHVAQELATALSESDTLARNTFYYLQRQFPAGDPQLLAFVRAERLSDDDVELRSLNVEPHLQGAGLSTELFGQVVDRYRGEAIIHGFMVPEAMAGMHYVEKNGFDATSFNSDAITTGTFYGLYDLTIDRVPFTSALRKLSKEEVQARVVQDPLQYIGEPSIVMQCALPEEIEKMRTVSAELLKNGEYRMTRYFATDRTYQRRVIGFERVVTNPTTVQTQSDAVQ